MYIFCIYYNMIFKTSKKIFIHLDCDSFFASCEILKNPQLKNKYICVWEEIIIACTYNCKSLWIKVWTPVWQAKKILGDKALFLRVDHEFYSQVSEKLFSFLSPYTITLEKFSIDECFCEITWVAEYFKMDLEKYLKFLQKKIFKELWISVSIWCAETRIKAKIYSKINKPFWIYIWLDTKKEKELFSKLEVWKIPFIWRKLQERLKYVAPTIYDFIKLWFWELHRIIWKNATDLRLELSWVNAFNPRSNSEVKSISRSRSFNKKLTNDFSFLLSQLNIHFSYVFEDITDKNLEIKSVQLMLRTKSFETLYFPYHFPDFTNNRKEIYEITKSLLIQNHDTTKIYRSVWIVFWDFRSYLPRQMSLFEKVWKTKETNYDLQKTINKINSKYHSHKVSFWTELLWIWSDVKLKIVN